MHWPSIVHRRKSVTSVVLEVLSDSSADRFVKIGFINLLDMQDVFVTKADVVLDHQFGQVRAVNENYTRS